jgi:hypothetical protein
MICPVEVIPSADITKPDLIPDNGTEKVVVPDGPISILGFQYKVVLKSFPD